MVFRRLQEILQTRGLLVSSDPWGRLLPSLAGGRAGWEGGVSWGRGTPQQVGADGLGALSEQRRKMSAEHRVLQALVVCPELHFNLSEQMHNHKRCMLCLYFPSPDSLQAGRYHCAEPSRDASLPAFQMVPAQLPGWAPFCSLIQRPVQRL